jgi:hypothetical protein
MARIRTIKPEAFQSESLAAVSLAAERTMFGLSTQADDRGRHPDKPLSINGAIWPERPDHTAADLENELQELVREGILCRYVGCDGRKYIHLVTWDRHQKIERPSKSRYPRCPHHPKSVIGKAEDCGVHPKNEEGHPCPLGEDSPNTHRTLGEGSCSPPTLFGDASEATQEPDSEETARQATDVNNRSSDGVSPNPHRTLTEPSVTDLGPRTLDRGPRTVDLGPRTKHLPPAAGADKPRVPDPTDPFNGKRTPTDADIEAHPDFADFWDAYPRKVDKGHARKAWAKAVRKGVDPKLITKAAETFRDDPGRNPQYTPHPATWLNGERWNDDPTPTTGRSTPPPQAAPEQPAVRREDPFFAGPWINMADDGRVQHGDPFTKKALP